MSKTASIRTFFENLLQNRQSIEGNFHIPRSEYEAAKKAYPQLVREAYDLYYENVECGDWGTVRFYLMPVRDEEIFVIQTTTDGDDGWLEVYDLTGNPLGLGKTYLEEIEWKGFEIRNSL